MTWFLVLHPRSMLTNILGFVGLDWDEVVMDHENHMDKVGLSGAERSTDQVFYLKRFTRKS